MIGLYVKLSDKNNKNIRIGEIAKKTFLENTPLLTIFALISQKH